MTEDAWESLGEVLERVLEKIKARLPGFPLVMHGSSTVPADLRDAINT